MTPAQVRRMYEEIVAEYGHADSPFCRLFEALIDLVDDLAVELSRTDIAMGRVLDLVTDGTFEASTLPEDWTDRPRG